MLHLAVKQDSITLFSILVKYSGKSFQTLRYYGYYSNKCRGMRKKEESGNSQTIFDQPQPILPQKTRNKRFWRERIIAIWGYDPLQCPCCQGPMKVVTTVQTLESIRVILIPLGLWEPPELRSVRAPRAPPSSVRWMADALDGTIIDLEPETLKGLMPDSRRFDPHHERLRAYHQESRSSNSDIRSSIVQLEDNLLLVLEDTESLPFESEPVFWMD